MPLHHQENVPVPVQVPVYVDVPVRKPYVVDIPVEGTPKTAVFL